VVDRRHVFFGGNGSGSVEFKRHGDGGARARNDFAAITDYGVGVVRYGDFEPADFHFVRQ